MVAAYRLITGIYDWLARARRAKTCVVAGCQCCLQPLDQYVNSTSAQTSLNAVWMIIEDVSSESDSGESSNGHCSSSATLPWVLHYVRQTSRRVSKAVRDQGINRPKVYDSVRIRARTSKLSVPEWPWTNVPAIADWLAGLPGGNRGRSRNAKRLGRNTVCR